MNRAVAQLEPIPRGMSLEDYAARVILSAWVLTGADTLPSNQRALSRAVARLYDNRSWPEPLQQRMYVTQTFDGPEWELLPAVQRRMQCISYVGFNNPGFVDYSPKISTADAADAAGVLAIDVEALQSIGDQLRKALKGAYEDLSPADHS